MHHQIDERFVNDRLAAAEDLIGSRIDGLLWFLGGHAVDADPPLLDQGADVFAGAQPHVAEQFI